MHTPGPWRSVAPRKQAGNGSAGRWRVDGSNGIPVADVLNLNQAANARLIAVAPELLIALKSCAAVVAGETMNKQWLIEALELARAAIAKAQG
jgi:hypothetical protein